MEVLFVLHVLMMCIPILGRPEKPEDYIEKDFWEMTTHGYVAVHYNYMYIQSILPMIIPYFTALQDWLAKQCFLQGLMEYSTLLYLYILHMRSDDQALVHTTKHGCKHRHSRHIITESGSISIYSLLHNMRINNH